jgi:hypothetical protein
MSEYEETDSLTPEEKLDRAIERLGGLEEIHRKPYAEFFDDVEVLVEAAKLWRIHKASEAMDLP